MTLIDIDTALTEIRVLTHALIELADRPLSTLPAEAATLGIDLAEHIEQLDGWLTRGGYVPAAWNVARKRPGVAA
jgi:hypothetical protein